MVTEASYYALLEKTVALQKRKLAEMKEQLAKVRAEKKQLEENIAEIRKLIKSLPLQ